MSENEKAVHKIIDKVDSNAESDSGSAFGIVLNIVGCLLLIFGVLDQDIGWLVVSGILIMAGMINCATVKICNELKKLRK